MQKYLSRLAILGLFLVPVLSAAPAQAQATRTWVSGVGDDANPCSRTAPCKTFAGAISKTATGGKINCLDPGGFGAVTITKSIEIDCFAFPGGILNAATNGVIVNGAGAKVVLRGIEIHGAGTGINGVRILNAAEVTLDKCFIIAQTGSGIIVTATNVVINLIVLDTNITQVAKGISMTASGASGAALAVMRNSSIYRTTTSGFELGSNLTFATISASVITGVTGSAVLVTGGNGQINVLDSVISFSGTGLNAAANGAVIRMSDNNIFTNTTSTAFVAGATLATAANNKLNPIGAVPNGTINVQ